LNFIESGALILQTKLVKEETCIRFLIHINLYKKKFATRIVNCLSAQLLIMQYVVRGDWSSLVFRRLNVTQCLQMANPHVRRRSNVFGLKDFDFCPNLIKFYTNFVQFAQISLKFSQILPEFAQLT